MHECLSRFCVSRGLFCQGDIMEHKPFSPLKEIVLKAYDVKSNFLLVACSLSFYDSPSHSGEPACWVLFLMILRAPGLQRWLWLLHHGDPVPGTEPITWNGCSRKHSRTKAWRLLWFLAIYLPRQLYSHNSTSAETFFHIFNTCMKFHLIVNYFKQPSIVLKVNKIKFFLNVLAFVKEIGCFVETL